ncbi:MAG: hypothetical protein GX224_02320 [Thermoplasmatales archaeon]|nr:hypothetical protein [Thermoplasmatales archaeon]
MRFLSHHFIFSEGSDYEDLVPVFPDILNVVLAENGHFQTEEEAETKEMFFESNMYDLERNRKPEGYNRKGLYRIVFPIDSKEFYIKTTFGKPQDLAKLCERISGMLTTKKFKFTTADDYETECCR